MSLPIESRGAPLRNGGGAVTVDTRETCPDRAVDRAPVLRWSTNRIAIIYLFLALALLPWVLVLSVELPDRQLSQNYRLAWVGFDLMLTAVLSRTAWLAWRRSPYLVIVASVAAALLIADAWFDVTTADSMDQRYFAIATAVLVELPLAAFSIRLARRAQKVIAAGFDSR
jgi:hypothetical protein